MNLVTVYNALNPADAELAHSRLEAAGFDVTITHEMSALTLGNTIAGNTALVQVPEEEADEARAFLASSEEPPPLP